MDNFRAIRCILRYLEKAMDFDYPDMAAISPERLGITRQRWNAVMAMLCEERLVDGLTVKRFADWAAAVFGEYPRITLKGLEYLEDSL